MAQLDQTATKNVTGPTLAGLLTSFKNSVGLRSSSGGMFASLLAETETSLPQVEKTSPHETTHPSATSRSSQGVASSDVESNSDVTGQVTRNDDRRTAMDDSCNTKATRAKAATKASDKIDSRTASETATKSTPTEETKKQDKKTAASDVSVQEDQPSVQEDSTDAAQDKSDDADMAALMATLMPVAEPVVKKAEGSEVTGGIAETTKAGDEQTAIDPDAAAWATLQVATDPLAGESASSKTKSALTREDKKSSAALQQLTTQPTQQAGLSSMGKDLLATAEGEAKTDDVKEESAGQYSKMVEENKTSSPVSVNTGTQTNAQDMYNLMRGNTQTQTASGVQSVVAAATTQLQNATSSTSEVSANTAVSAGGGKAAQVSLPTGEGVRPTGSYDFASQLSAARVTKGGATGLPQAVEQVSVQLNKAAKDGIDEMTIQLRPAELGKIEIKLEFGADKSVTGTVVADNQATLNMLQKDSASLHRALQDAGLQADAGCMQFSLRDDNNASQFANQQQNGQGNKSSFSNDNLTNEKDLLAQTSDVETYYISPGRVNLRV